MSLIGGEGGQNTIKRFELDCYKQFCSLLMYWKYFPDHELAFTLPNQVRDAKATLL